MSSRGSHYGLRFGASSARATAGGGTKRQGRNKALHARFIFNPLLFWCLGQLRVLVTRGQQDKMKPPILKHRVGGDVRIRYFLQHKATIKSSCA